MWAKVTATVVPVRRAQQAGRPAGHAPRGPSTKWQVGGRSPGSRGAIAIMAALLIPTFLVLMVGLLEYGLLILQRQQGEQTSDAAALAFAHQYVKSPIWKWQSIQPDYATICKSNSTGDVCGISVSTIDYAQNMLAIYPDAWAPAYVGVQQQMPVRQSGAGLLSLARQFGLNLASPNLATKSTARIKQVQLSSFRFVPERVVMVLDFSRTMDLNYAGSNTAAKDVLKGAVDRIIQHYGALVDLGVLTFSDGPANQQQTALVVQNANTTYDQYSTQQDRANSQVQGAKTSGDGTDLPGAVQEGLSMLRQAVADGDPTELSQARLILITDGEPDQGTGSPADKIARGRQETADAMSQVWNTDQANGGAVGGIVSDVFFVQREGQDDASNGAAGTPTSDFLGSLAGTKAVNNSAAANQNFFLKDLGDPTAIDAFINTKLTLQPRCYFPALIDNSVKNWRDTTLARKYILPATTTQTPLNPGAQRGETLYAYLAPNAIARPNLEYPMRVWVNNLLEYTSEQQNAGAMSQADDAVVPDDYFLRPENQNQLLLHYDSNSNVVTVGGMLCAALYSAYRQSQDTRMRIRLRWGQPRLVSRLSDKSAYCSSSYLAECGS